MEVGHVLTILSVTFELIISIFKFAYHTDSSYYTSTSIGEWTTAAKLKLWMLLL